jgi:LysR family transcriptional regulator, transcriptional activator of nhaA
MNWLNYHHLYYFWTAVREGGVVRASKKLRLAQSTISAQLSNLEESLGGKLFQRVGRNLEPTDLGQLVFRYADEIFSIGKEMMDTIEGLPAQGVISLKVGIVDVIPKLVARKLLEPARNLPEKVRLSCHEGKVNDLLGELALHNLDVVITDAPHPPGMSIKAYNHLLGECGTTFFAVKSLATRLRRSFPQSLNGAPMLLPMQMSALRGLLDQWFHKLNIVPQIAAEFDDSALLKVFGQLGDGVFAAPTIIEKEVKRQYQVDVVGRTNDVKEKFYAISVERILKNPAIAAISDSAQKEIFKVEKICP